MIIISHSSHRKYIINCYDPGSSQWYTAFLNELYRPVSTVTLHIPRIINLFKYRRKCIMDRRIEQ